jgi:hypothetical protein
MALSDEWMGSLSNTHAWLDNEQRHLQALGEVPTDLDRINEQIEEQKIMAMQVEEYRDQINALVDTEQQLAALVSVADAKVLDKQLVDVETR